MADIALTNVYNAAQRAFAVRGSGNDRFDSDFLDAANRSIGELNNKADLETRVESVTSVDDTVENLDTKYEHCLTAGIWRWLILAGRKPQQGFERQVNHLASLFEDYIGEMQDDLRNDRQDANGSDDDTYDIIGLGKLGG